MNVKSLLLSMFDAESLYRFLEHRCGKNFVNGLCSPLRGNDIFTHEAVAALQRHGLLGEGFYRALLASFPGRRADIVATARQHSGLILEDPPSPPPDTPEPDPPPPPPPPPVAEEAAKAELNEEAQRLAKAIAEDLRERWALRSELKRRLGLASDEPEVVATALVQQPAARVAECIVTIDRSLFENGHVGERDILWTLLRRILPYTLDWAETIRLARARILEARMAGLPEPTTFEFACRVQTIAEVLLAGLDGRPCSFVPAGPRLTGLCFLSWPAAALAPVYSGADNLVDALLQKMSDHLRISVQECMMLRQLATEHHAHWEGEPASALASLRARLKVAVREAGADRPRPHLLLIDDVLGAAAPQAWKVAVNSVGSALPSLRLVRLTGGAAEMEIEEEINVWIEKLYRARPQGSPHA